MFLHLHPDQNLLQRIEVARANGKPSQGRPAVHPEPAGEVAQRQGKGAAVRAVQDEAQHLPELPHVRPAAQDVPRGDEDLRLVAAVGRGRLVRKYAGRAERGGNKAAINTGYGVLGGGGREADPGAGAKRIVVVGGNFAFAGGQPAGPPVAVWRAGGLDLLARTANGTSVLGLMPVVPMTLISALLMVVVSLATPPPSEPTLRRYFPQNAA